MGSHTIHNPEIEKDTSSYERNAKYKLPIPRPGSGTIQVFFHFRLFFPNIVILFYLNERRVDR